jgi:peptidoglycan/xylan/chitin deacetylase (PgdA/CDA1 family)
MKQLFLALLRAVGGFIIARWLLRDNLLILCYHGFSLLDEEKFDSLSFISPERFVKRLKILQDQNYPVLKLEDAVEKLSTGRLPKKAVVITIDDGWSGVYRHAVKALTDRNCSATVYITTYYVQKNIPVFNVFLDYLFWRSNMKKMDLSELLDGEENSFDLSDNSQRTKAISLLKEKGESVDAQRRYELMRKVAEILGLNCEKLGDNKLFRLMTLAEIRHLAELGIDIQLHTHRHLGKRTLNNRRLFFEEVETNRAVLSLAAVGPFEHYCYPSGFYHSRQSQWLRELGIKSATTTELGLNRRGDDVFTLKRFVDSESVSDLQFQAELCGILDLLRRMRSLLREVM